MFLALVMVLALVPTFTIASTAAITADTSWYNADAPAGTVFEIGTAEELLGFANLLSELKNGVNYNYFTGHTIKLTADIDLNPGWDASGTANPTNYWPGMTARTFEGTIDGNGYTVSGIFVTTEANGMGIFGGKATGATVKNLKITNSKAKGLGQLGGLFGLVYGNCTIENVYADIIVEGNNSTTAESERVGGFAGSIEANATLSIKNSVFAGTVTHLDSGVASANSTRVGGFVGGNVGANATLTIENSAFYGTVHGNKWAIGGFLGVNSNATSKTVIKNSVSAGTVKNDTENPSTGAFVGQVQNNSVVTLENCVYTTVTLKDTATDAAIQGVAGVAGQAILIDGATLVGATPEGLTGYKAMTDAMPWPTTLYNVMMGIIVPDTSWYNADAPAGTVFEISTVEQFYGFAQLLSALNESGVNYNYFTGHTIKLMADFDLNPKWDATGTANPTNYWPGMTNRTFEGTIDGNGHAVSGIYVTMGAKNASVGMFGGIANNATIKNLVITNSYIQTTATENVKLGGLFGVVQGNTAIENVYADIIVKGINRVGGFASQLNAGAKLTITGSVFAGTIADMTQLRGAGFVGQVDNAECVIENCAFYGNVKGSAHSYSGFVGGVTAEGGAGKVTIKNSISAGSIVATANQACGALFGQVRDDAGASATIENCVYTPVTVNGAVIDSAYQKPSNSWKNTPWGDGAVYASTLVGKAVLSTFTATETMPLPTDNPALAKGIQVELAYLADSSWYNADATTFEIGTPEELLGFAKLLSGGTTFANQTLTLTADVDLNPGWEAGATAPTNVWPAMSGANRIFSGTFDGSGNTISGIYLSENASRLGIFAEAQGATVKNLVVTNTYIHGNHAVGTLFGAASSGTCSIENVYSDAIIYGCTDGAQNLGGLSGSVEAGTTLNIIGSVYAGTLTHLPATSKATKVGGLVGGVQGASTTLNIQTSAFYGTVISKGWEVGGLVGEIDNQSTSKLTIKNSISAGLVNNQTNNPATGAFLGRWIGTGAVVKIESSYYTDVYSKDVVYDWAIGRSAAEGGAMNGVEGTNRIADKATLLNGTVPANLTDFVAMPGYEILPINLVNPVWKNNTDATTMCDLYQKGTTVNDLRLIGLVNGDVAALTAVGYDIEMIRANGNTWTNKVEGEAPSVYALYTSVKADGVKKTAEELGGDYIFVATIGGMDTTVNENITIVVKTFHDTAEGRVYDDVIVFTYNPATAQVNA